MKFYKCKDGKMRALIEVEILLEETEIEKVREMLVSKNIPGTDFEVRKWIRSATEYHPGTALDDFE